MSFGSTRGPRAASGIAFASLALALGACNDSDKKDETQHASASQQTTVTVPLLRGKEAKAAFAQLSDAGLKPRLEHPFASLPVGEVVDSDPPSGTKVKRGSSVKLIVSRGSKPEEASSGGSGGSDNSGSSSGGSGASGGGSSGGTSRAKGGGCPSGYYTTSSGGCA